jgi:uncharacterized membrane protein YeaQ/YmgE (transglycosylase-associated protein family)
MRLRVLALLLLVLSTEASHPPVVKSARDLRDLEVNQMNYISKTDMTRAMLLGAFMGMVADAIISYLDHSTRPVAVLCGALVGAGSAGIMHGILIKLNAKKDKMSYADVMKTMLTGMIVGGLSMAIAYGASRKALFGLVGAGVVGGFAGGAMYHTAEAYGTMSYSEFRLAFGTDIVKMEHLIAFGIPMDKVRLIMRETHDDNSKEYTETHLISLFDYVAGLNGEATLDDLENRLFFDRQKALRFMRSYDREGRHVPTRGKDFIKWIATNHPNRGCVESDMYCTVKASFLAEMINGVTGGKVACPSGREAEAFRIKRSRLIASDYFARSGLPSTLLQALLDTMRRETD